MKILYAVQATGNGHITRARIMAKAFKKLNIDVDWIFTGRPKEDLFDMEPFGDFQVYRGMTFAIKNGTIDYIATIFKNNIFHFLRDVFRVRFDDYDLVINDFEPVTAWAAKLRKVETVGISHQMAFSKQVPIAGKNFIANLVLKNFAPSSQRIGLHWNDFEESLLPPIIDNDIVANNLSPKEVLVYFPFCEAEKLIEWFAPFNDYNFHIFHGSNQTSGYNHINFYHFSRSDFQDKQKSCGGIITAAGFELPSEAIQMGHKLLVMPLENQMEQQSNALALKQLERAHVLHHFSNKELKKWLQAPLQTPKPYPDVAYELAKWLVNSKNESLENLSKRLWQKTAEPIGENELNLQKILCQ
ncbi:MJ1255/VC2487 family glycosyltransferase [Aliikangiella coralliicola]|uniref:Glycosyl transferase n=1 Tax=Aliikangiella coralliicola TaxID=2592383 RepID=A0A545UBL7_9GAMM|nr:MJ1255/VC2487 family glycosyltransferase [Aliikangiella coralliicola]TQV86858.1 glycosyl transferase [Aliikangiella coralliicola]